MMQTLSDVVAKAFEINPGYLSWQDRLAQAEARSAMARTSLRPTLTAQGAVDYVDDNSVHNDQLIVPTPEMIRNERYRAGVSLDLPIWSLESNRRVAKAKNEQGIDQASQDSASLALESEIATAYFEALCAHSARSIQQLQIHLANTTTEIARGMVASGERPRAELTRWRAEELFDRQLVAGLETEQRTTQVRLNAIMNQPSGNAFLLDSTLLSEDAFWHAYELIRPHIATEVNRQQTINQLVQAALTESPPARRATAAINTQSTQLSVLRATQLPTVGVRSSLDFTDKLGSYADLDEENPSWSVGAYLRWPLFDGGHRKKEMQSARARLSELEYLKDQTSLQLMEEISRLVRILSGAAAQAMAAEREAELSTAIVASAIEDYSSGAAGIDATVRAGQSASDAQNRLVDARARFLTSLYQLVCTIGWSPQRESLSPAQLLRQRLSGK
jgi:outer membrane protein TolC